jgi:tripartite-type tricarboxylate transporter receptor subunit TctC
MAAVARVLMTSLFGILAAGPQIGIAQEYPSKPIRAVIPFPPGTPQDFILRLISERVQTGLKQPLIIENRPGATGAIGTEIVAKAPADGYTILVTVDSVVTINPHVYRKLTYKPEDLVPVIYLANSTLTLACHPSVGVTSAAGLVAHAKSNRVNYASGGAGAPGHLAMEMFTTAAGITMNHVPYKGPVPAAQDMLAGHVQCGFLATIAVLPHVKAGKLSGLAVSTSKRSPIAPELPTLAEAGIAGFNAGFGEMVLVPRGTPEPVIRLLADEMAKALAQPDVRERMVAADLEYPPGTPAEAAARLQRESAKWKQVVERIKLQVD